MTRGRFISFEGGEGTGKSTQAAMLADILKPFGIEVVLTREPGGSPGAEVMRHVLLSGAAKPFGVHAEAILFAAARDDHVRQTIRPALERHQWVISDRFSDSTRIYQGALSNVDPRVIKRLEQLTVGSTVPDLTIILDVPAEMGLTRAAKRRGSASPDRFETETIDFHRKLRDAYRDLAEREPGRCALIDATADATSVCEAVWAVVDARLKPSRRPAAPEDPGS